MFQQPLMRTLLLTCCFLFVFASPLTTFAANKSQTNENASLHDINAMLINGKKKELSEFKGKVLLVTNVAVKCGTTPQLKALQKLHTEFEPKGLVVLGFPSGDFHPKKENPSKNQVHEKCSKEFGVTFPLFSPDYVSGPEKQEVYAFLTTTGEEEMQGEVSFNFEKFLVDKNGKVRERFGAFTGAQSDVLKRKIEALLAE